MEEGEAEKYSPDQQERLNRSRTSIRAVLPAPGGGRIVTMGFPGLAFDAAGAVIFEPERMRATLGDAALEQARILIVLVEPEEVPEGALEAIGAFCAGRGLALAHLPIRDYQVPGRRFAAGWAAAQAQMAAALVAGATVGLSCHYGAGRSGMIAAALLIDRGLTAEAAVAQVRAQFPDSIETEAQMGWLEARARGQDGPR